MNVIKKACKDLFWTCLSVLVGNVLIAFSIAAFVIPNGLIMGGATGLSILICRFFKTDVAMVVLVLNFLTLLLGYFVLGKKFVLTTVGSSLLYPVLLSLAQRIPGITAMTDDLLLASLLAGGLIGLAVGLVMRVGASTGGTDGISLILHKWLYFPVPVFVYLIDFIVLGGQSFFSEPNRILYGIVLSVVETITLDKVMLVGQTQIQILVISSHFEYIRKRLILELQAGVKMIMIETGCAGKTQKGVLCVIPPRKLYAAKEIIQSVDSDSFTIITQIKEVRGQGFTLARKNCASSCQITTGVPD